MKEKGIAIPDARVIKYSNLGDKAEIIEEMAQQPKGDPEKEAKAKLALAQADKVQAETANTRITSQYGAVQAAKEIALAPAIAPLADALTKSAGVVDQDAAPNIPAPPPGTAPSPVPIDQNTSPTFPGRPASPDVGARAGIEKGGVNGEA